MRTLVEIFVIGALIYFGWEKPFKESVDQVRSKLTGKPTAVAPQEVAPTPAAPTPTPAPRIVPGTQGLSRPTPSGAWMWDPNHRSALDRPAYDQTQPQTRYHDASGRSYWIDAQGVRHYDQ
jgi:hypothetical protein